MSLNGASFAGPSATSEEVHDAFGHRLQLLVGDSWKERERQELLGQRLRDGKAAAPISQPPERARQMRRLGIVAAGHDPALEEELRERLAPSRPDDVEVPHVLAHL